MMRTARQIKKLLRGFEYRMGSGFASDDVIIITPRYQDYNKVRQILEDNLTCKVSRLTLHYKKKNIIYVFTEIRKDK